MKKIASIRLFGKVRLRGWGLAAACLLSIGIVEGDGLSGMWPADTTDVSPVSDTLRGYGVLEKDSVWQQGSQETRQEVRQEADSVRALQAMERILGLPADTLAAVGEALTQDSAQTVRSSRGSDTEENDRYACRGGNCFCPDGFFGG